jgi:hypothetical protein
MKYEDVYMDCQEGVPDKEVFFKVYTKLQDESHIKVRLKKSDFYSTMDDLFEVGFTNPKVELWASDSDLVVILVMAKPGTEEFEAQISAVNIYSKIPTVVNNNPLFVHLPKCTDKQCYPGCAIDRLPKKYNKYTSIKNEEEFIKYLCKLIGGHKEVLMSCNLCKEDWDYIEDHSKDIIIGQGMISKCIKDVKRVLRDEGVLILISPESEPLGYSFIHTLSENNYNLMDTIWVVFKDNDFHYSNQFEDYSKRFLEGFVVLKAEEVKEAPYVEPQRIRRVTRINLPDQEGQHKKRRRRKKEEAEVSESVDLGFLSLDLFKDDP